MTKLPSDIIGQKARSLHPGCGPMWAMAERPVRCYVAPMASFLGSIILPLAVVAVAFVLLLGLINMMRGGSPHLSQRLMRLRVLMQFIALIVIMLTIWVMRG